MSRIKGKNTKPEMLLRKALWAKGFRYRLHAKIQGKPDVVFISQRVAIFVDGCFWHGCPLHSVKPKSNRKFWEDKLKSNRIRDKRVTASLRQQGWKVIRIWEHEIKNNLEKVLINFEKILRNC